MENERQHPEITRLSDTPVGSNNTTRSKLAVATFILAWSSLVLSCLAGLPVMILAVVADHRICKSEGKLYGRGWAWWGFGIALTLSIAFCIWVPALVQDKSEKNMPKAAIHKLETSIPKTTLFKEDIADSHNKTQVKQLLVVQKPVNKSQIRSILLSHWKETRKRKGFKHHNKPTHIALYLFDSEETAKAGAAQQLGQLWWRESEHGNNPDITLYDRAIDAQKSKVKPEIKWGLSEEKRREIYKEMVKAEDRADKVAWKKYPDLDPQQPRYTTSKATARVKKRMKLADQLVEKYKRETREKYGITAEQWEEISKEAMAENWPLP